MMEYEKGGREKGERKKEFRNQVLPAKNQDGCVCVFVFSDTGSQPTEAHWHVTNLNI